MDGNPQNDGPPGAGEARRPTWIRFLQHIGLPIGVYLATFWFVHTCLNHLNADWRWANYVCWDALHYYEIGTTGYERFPCPNDPNTICGNVGWFPGYPVTFAPLAAFIEDARWPMLAVTWLFGAAGFVLLFLLMERCHGRRAAVWTVVAAGASPASMFWIAGFPYGLYLLLSALTVYAGLRRWWLLAAPAAGYLAITYPSGLLILIPVAAPLAGELWARMRPATGTLAPPLEGSARLGSWCAVAAVGTALLAYGLYNLLAFDDFFLYVHFQSKYLHVFGQPLHTLTSWYRLWEEKPAELAAIAFAALTTAAFWAPRLPWSWRIYGLALLLFTPFCGSFQSYYRHILPCWPMYAAIAVAPLHDRWRAVWVIISLLLSLSIYLPMFAAGRLM